jgi:hypothetical protein
LLPPQKMVVRCFVGGWLLSCATGAETMPMVNGSERNFLETIGGRVADGEPVDWDEAEKGATDANGRSLIQQFRVIAVIAACHREEGAFASRVPESRGDRVSIGVRPFSRTRSC